MSFGIFSLASCRPINFDEFFNGGTVSENHVRGIEVDLSKSKTTYTINEEFSTPYVNVLYTKTPKERADERYLSYEGFDSTAPGQKTINVSYVNGEEKASASYTVTISDSPVVPPDPGDEYEEVVFDEGINATYYSNGNYGVVEMNEVTLSYYRAYNYSTEFVTLFPLSQTFDYIETKGGSIGNITPIKDIKSIEVAYFTNSTLGTIHPTISYGEKNYKYTVTLDYSSATTTIQLDEFTEGVNYFQISSGDVQMTIESIIIEYSNLDTVNGNEFTLMPAYEDSFRVVPSPCSDILIPGVTQATAYTQYIPTNIVDSKTKTYTYYTFDYICEHPEFADDAKLTDPIDVANYFTLFKEAPANYVIRDNYSLASPYFGSDTRCKSYYSRTDGYAKAIENVNASSGYWELDIALSNSYGQYSRGVGRLVCWQHGINDIRYGNGSQPVCHFTDDHYSTFQEYDNGGRFLKRFNAELSITNYYWCPPTNHL